MKRIDGTTRIAGLVGHPIGNSLSPAMHNAVYEELGLNWVYVPLGLPDEVALRRFMALAPSLDCVGFNVTMPYKQAVLELCDEVALAARMAGAVNTVHVVDGRLVGYNTDGRGLIEALDSEAGFRPEGKDVVIVGAGGAAGAAYVSFLLARASSVTVVSRTVTSAEDLLERLESHAGAVRTAALGIAEAADAVSAADLIVNATPAGMDADDPPPFPLEWIKSGQTVFDMVYGTALPTALVEHAAAVGATAVDGLGMLVAQGATAVDIWNDAQGLTTPRDVMRAAAESALAERRAVVRRP